MSLSVQESTGKLQVKPEAIPAELAERPQWVRWRFDDRQGKPTKVPYNPKTKYKAQSTNKATWGAFSVALENYPKGFDGIGFMFASDDPYVGIDLDHCRNSETGELAPWAREILDDCATYAEVSPSGKGVKLFARTSIPVDRGRKVAVPGEPHNGDGIPAVEIYDRGRYFTVTGWREGDHDTVADCTEGVSRLLAKLDDWKAQKRHRNGKDCKRLLQPSRPGSSIVDRARKFIAKMPPAIEGDDGSGTTFHVACVLFRFGLNDADAWQLLQEFNDRCVPPWSESDLRHKLESARQTVEAAGEVGSMAALEGKSKSRHSAQAGEQSDDEAPTPIANFKVIEIENEADDDEGEGEKQTKVVPLSMTEIIDDINDRMNGWPRRVDNMLFVDDQKHGLDYFDRRTTAAFFGWLRRHHHVTWVKGGNYVSQSELFAETERTCRRYEAVELLPHDPPIEGIYYRGGFPEPGDGSHLRQLLDRFRPETTIDRDLIQAAMMTAFWGGLPGCRPAFVITSDDGRGVGKSKVPESIGYLCGGHIDVSAGEDIETLKTRMLTPGARTKRIALLDNVKSLRLSWAELEAMITCPIISGRQLYVGEGQRPNLLTWFITLNGVSMATDMAQRSVIIKVVKGKNDGPWWEQTRQFIDDHRQKLIGDIFGALRAAPFPLAEFTRWATWEQHVLSKLPEPGEAQRVILERQGTANCDLDEAEIIEGHFAEQLRRLDYNAETAQVRIPVSVAARWYGWAVGEPTKTAAASKRLHQMADEGQMKRITPDSTRTYGRCFIWTGEGADVVGEAIDNDLAFRLGERAT